MTTQDLQLIKKYLEVLYDLTDNETLQYLINKIEQNRSYYMNNVSLTTKNNKRAIDALNKITPLTVSLIRSQRASNIWKLRNSIPMYLESQEVFDQNMKLIDEELK